MSLITPCELANRCFERLRYLPQDDINYCGEIKEEMKAMSLDVDPQKEKQLVKSAGVQLYRRLKQHQESLSCSGSVKKSTGMKKHQNQILTDVEEAILCGILISQRQLGMKITLRHVKQEAALAYSRPFGKSRAKRFLERNSNIFNLSHKKSMSEGRSSDVTFDQCELFCSAFEELQQTLAAKNIPIHPDTLCNMDETLLRITSNGHLNLELVPRGERTGTRSSSKCSPVGSMLVFMSASGAVPFVFFCMKKEAKQKKYLVPKLILNQES